MSGVTFNRNRVKLKKLLGIRSRLALLAAPTLLVFALSGRAREDVSATSTEDYFAEQVAAGKLISPRPKNSAMNLAKIRATGFEPAEAMDALKAYLS